MNSTHGGRYVEFQLNCHTVIGGGGGRSGSFPWTGWSALFVACALWPAGCATQLPHGCAVLHWLSSMCSQVVVQYSTGSPAVLLAALLVGHGGAAGMQGCRMCLFDARMRLLTIWRGSHKKDTPRCSFEPSGSAAWFSLITLAWGRKERGGLGFLGPGS